MRKLICLVMVLVTALTAVVWTASAEISPLSSEVFHRASVSCSSGTATFSARVNIQCSSISVTSCTLQKFENGSWVFAATLATPESKSNTYTYFTTKDYSSSMSTGVTYRIKATFEAGGDSVTTTSKSFTY